MDKRSFTCCFTGHRNLPAGQEEEIWRRVYACLEPLLEEGGRALIGNVMMAYLYYVKKVAGIVLDGPIRDIDEISQWDFPVYCTGTTPGGPYKEGPGEVNVPIACGGISVSPGDIIVGDRNGVCVIPPEFAEQVIAGAQEKVEKMERLSEEIRRTGKVIPDNFAANLEKLGY